MAIRKTPSGPKAPTKKVVEEIVRRYINPDRTPIWGQDLPLFYAKLWPAYPSEAFWTRHELPFPLNSLAWFLTEEGKAQLARDWATFHYTPPAPEAAPILGVDTAPQPPYNVPQAKPRTVAAFLTNGKDTSR